MIGITFTRVLDINASQKLWALVMVIFCILGHHSKAMEQKNPQDVAIHFLEREDRGRIFDPSQFREIKLGFRELDERLAVFVFPEREKSNFPKIAVVEVDRKSLVTRWDPQGQVFRYYEPSIKTVDKTLLNIGLTGAAEDGDIEELLTLLKKGADPGGTNQALFSALYYAAVHGHLTSVRVLVAAGAPVNYRNPNIRETAAEAAKKAGHIFISAFLEIQAVRKPDGTFIRRVAERINSLKNHYSHFAGFNIDSSYSEGRLSYSHGLKYLPNPNYLKLMQEEKELDRTNPERMRTPVPETVPSYSPKDGIYLFVELHQPGEFSQNVLPAYTNIGNAKLEVVIEGAASSQLKEIRELIQIIIDQEKKHG